MAVRRAGLEQLRAARDHRVHGITLQLADLDRLLAFVVEHAGAFAQDRGRADAGAALSQDVSVQDGFGRAAQIAGQNLADELRNVDPGGTGLDAGSVMAEQTARSFFERLRRREWRVDVREVLLAPFSPSPW